MKNVSVHQYIKLKIELFRLRIPTTYDGANAINQLLSKNIEDIDYNYVSWNFEDRVYFMDTVRKFYTIVNSLNNITDLFKIIEVYDLSSYINSLDSSFIIDGANTTTLKIVDISSLQKNLPDFEFYEQDVIRVRIYDSNIPFDTSLRNLKSKYPSFTDEEINDCMYKGYFMGFVSDINENKKRGQPEEISLTLQSLYKLFQINAMIFNLALADSFTSVMDGMDILDSQYLTVWQNRFTDKSAKDIVVQMMNEILVCSSIGNEGSMFFDMNSIKQRYIIPTLTQNKFIFHPLFRHLLTIMAAKSGAVRSTTFSPMLVFDDEFSTITTKYPVDLSSQLFPYLLQTKTSYSNYESNYEMPSELVDRIRSETFFEFFEDKDGIFHFRAPRYNEKISIYSVSHERVFSWDYHKADSTVYSAVGMTNMMPLVGALELPNRVFFNKFLVAKYGLRIPKIFQNPNVLTPHIGDLFAKFYSDYFNSLSRTASIQQTGVSGLQVGQMVFFSKDDSGKGHIGYLSELRESITIGGAYTQTLSLSFVRESYSSASVHNYIKNVAYSLIDYLTEATTFDDKLVLLTPYLDAAATQEAQQLIQRQLTLTKSDTIALNLQGNAAYVFRPIMSLFEISRSLTLEDLNISANVKTYETKRDKSISPPLTIADIDAQIAQYETAKTTLSARREYLLSFYKTFNSAIANYVTTSLDSALDIKKLSLYGGA